MNPLLQIHEVSKAFPQRQIIQTLSYTFEKGCYCLLGANGIGKSTVLEIIAGIVQHDSGTISLHGKEIVLNNTLDFKQQLCYVPSTPQFFPNATGTDFINFIVSVKCSDQPFDSAPLNQLISEFKLQEYLDCKFSSYSLGTQKKLFLTTLAIGTPSIIILDEPTNGLDAAANQVLVSLLSKLMQSAIVIIVTHDPEIFSQLSPCLLHLTQSPIFNFVVHEGICQN